MSAALINLSRLDIFFNKLPVNTCPFTFIGGYLRGTKAVVGYAKSFLLSIPEVRPHKCFAGWIFWVSLDYGF
jgi:hypothetical protein